MKISFTTFDSTSGLGQPGDQTGSRHQTVILPFTLWDKWEIYGRRLSKLRHVFRTQSVLYFSSFKKWNWFPEDLTISQYNITNLNKYAVSMPGSRTSFSKYSMSGSPYIVDVELIQIEKNRIVLCYVFLDHYCLTVWNSATARQFMQLSDAFARNLPALLWCSKYSVSGSTVFLEFWVNVCRITDSSSATLSQIIKKFPNIFLNSVC